MLFDLMWFDCSSFVLLLYFVNKFCYNLLSNMFHMSTAFCSRDTIDETDLIELTVAHGKSNFPSIVDDLMNQGRFWCRIEDFHSFGNLLFSVGIDVHFDILLEALDLDAFTVEINFDSFNTASKIVDTTFHYGFEVGIKAFHAKSLEIWLEYNLGVFFAGFVGRDLCFSNNTHILTPGLNILLLSCFISSFDSEFGAEDVGEFGTVPISATYDFFLVVVVVA